MPKIPPQKHPIYEEWLYLEPDGELGRDQRAELERHLTTCGACRSLRREIGAMSGWLTSANVEADPALAQRVMESLPPAGWETRNPRSWRAAGVIFALLATGALVGALGGGQSAAAAPVLGAARAVTDLLMTTALAGAGLLTASWQGLGLALGEVFGGSKVTLGVFAVFVAGIDFLVIRYLLRQPRRALATDRRPRR